MEIFRNSAKRIFLSRIFLFVFCQEENAGQENVSLQWADAISHAA